jgi:hypothetical protein
MTGLDRPLGLQEVEDPRFLDNRHMKVRGGVDPRAMVRQEGLSR